MSDGNCAWPSLAKPSMQSSQPFSHSGEPSQLLHSPRLAVAQHMQKGSSSTLPELETDERPVQKGQDCVTWRSLLRLLMVRLGKDEKLAIAYK
eukprot:scaffold673530_cov41-Prasinocladus_malaysianus.AAC.1